MIQFNLLPSVKLDYVQTRRNKRVVLVFASLITIAVLAVMIGLFFYVSLQKKHSTDLSKDIKSQTTQLKSIKDIDKILTIQNQLSSLDALHSKKPVATRLLNYVKQLTPAKVTIASLDVDFDGGTMSITGSADGSISINKFADTLKFTTYKTAEENPRTGSAFSEVVLTSYGKDTKGASYQLTFKFDPIIFDSSSEVALDFPVVTTTRSETEKPELFQPLSNPGGQQ